MNRYTIVVVSVLVCAGILLAVFSETDSSVEQVTEDDVFETVEQQFANVGLGLAFVYRGGQDGYTLIEPDTPQYEVNYLKTIMLVHADDMPMIENPPIASEGPPVLTFTVFSNKSKQSAARWVEAHQSYSNLERAVTEPTHITVAGADAIRYRVDGLYLSEVVVIAHAGFIYVVNGSYRDAMSPIYKDFDTIVNSITFPTAT